VVWYISSSNSEEHTAYVFKDEESKKYLRYDTYVNGKVKVKLSP
jgi:hypothetical protein